LSQVTRNRSQRYALVSSTSEYVKRELHFKRGRSSVLCAS